MFYEGLQVTPLCTVGKTDLGGRIFDGSERMSRAPNHTPTNSEDSPVELAILGQNVPHRPHADDNSVPTQLRSRFATVARQVQYLNPTPTSPRRMRWHPKITPYRLVVILLPITFATLKAVISQTGNKTVPITLEWVFGIVVFLMLAPSLYYHTKNIHAVFLDSSC